MAWKTETKYPVDVVKKFFGRESFIPDWRKAEAIDDVATKRFLERYWSKYKGVHDVGNQGGVPDWVTDKEKAAGVLIWPVDYDQETLPKTIPTADLCKLQTMGLYAAQGESEPFAIAVRALDKEAEVSIETSDLIGPGKIEKADITNRLCLAFEFAFKKNQKQLQPVIMLKTPENKWKFPPNYTMVYWVDVHVPAEAKPGKYTGQIIVKANGKEAKTIRMEMDVLPFRLKANNYRAGTFNVTFGLWAGGFTGFYEPLMEIDSRYGYNIAGGFYNKGQEIPFKGKFETLEVDETHEKFKKFDERMKGLKKYGMGDVLFWNWGASVSGGGDKGVAQFNNILQAANSPGIATPEGKKGFAHTLRAIKAGEKKYGWPDMVIGPFDEALGNQDATKEVIAAMPYVHAISPESRVYMTEWHVGYTRLYQSEGETLSGKKRPGDSPGGAEYKALAGKKPVYNFAVIGANKFDEEARAIQTQFNGEYWNYGIATKGDVQARFIQGFQTWITKHDTSLLWAGYFALSFDVDGGWTTHIPMPDNVGDTKHTQGPILASVKGAIGRESIDDRKYLETLRFYATEKKSQPDLDWLEKELSVRCKAMSTGLDKAGGIANIDVFLTNAKEMPKLRLEIRDRILKLIK
ncbi:MAG: hypothetical protein V1899_11100 [Planctomycetota bacterium]